MTAAASEDKKRLLRAGKVTLGKPKWPLVEIALEQETRRRRQRSARVSVSFTRTPAKQLTKQHCPEDSAFSASQGWVLRFRKRKKIKFRCRQSKKKLSVEEKREGVSARVDPPRHTARCASSNTALSSFICRFNNSMLTFVSSCCLLNPTIILIGWMTRGGDFLRNADTIWIKSPFHSSLTKTPRMPLMERSTSTFVALVLMVSTSASTRCISSTTPVLLAKMLMATLI